MDETQFHELRNRLRSFMAEHIYPNEQLFHEQCQDLAKLPGDQWVYPDVIVKLKEVAKKLGLWNLWLPNDTAEVAGQGYQGAGLSNAQYAELCEIMGTANHMEFAALATNCASPDTGNMETLARFGNEEQKAKWLKPLLDGDIKSCFAMTEPQVASSDASNISIEIVKDVSKNRYVVNGRKIWITGAGSTECKIMILMGKTDPNAPSFKQQSMLLVPTDSPGITMIRPMHTMNDPEAPKGHMEILFENVVVPLDAVLGGEGRGFEIAQARLGPGRIHHCMRLIGTAERALSALVSRAESRVAFGKKLVDFDNIMQDIARSRSEIDMARMLVRHTANLLDTVGSKACRKELSMCKAVVPKMVQDVCDRAMQVHGAIGISQDYFLANAFSWARWLRFADGPDDVHLRTVARLEAKQQKNDPAKLALYSLGPYSHHGPVHRKNPPSKL